MYVVELLFILCSRDGSREVRRDTENRTQDKARAVRLVDPFPERFGGCCARCPSRSDHLLRARFYPRYRLDPPSIELRYRSGPTRLVATHGFCASHGVGAGVLMFFLHGGITKQDIYWL